MRLIPARFGSPAAPVGAPLSRAPHRLPAADTSSHRARESFSFCRNGACDAQ